MVYFANPANHIGMCVNLQNRGSFVSRRAGPRLRAIAWFLDVLDLDEISSFLNWKRQWVPIPQEMML